MLYNIVCSYGRTPMDLETDVDLHLHNLLQPMSIIFVSVYDWTYKSQGFIVGTHDEYQTDQPIMKS